MCSRTMSTKKLFALLFNITIILSLSIIFLIEYSRHNTSRNQSYEPDLERRELLEQKYTFVPQPYETDNKNCSVRVISTEEEFEKFVKHDAENAGTCTMKYFKDYMYKHQRLVGTGTFYAPPDGLPLLDTLFYPEGCTFSNHITDIGSLRTCFQKRNVKTMVMTGDSNSVVMRQQLDDYIRDMNGGKKCSRLSSCKYGLDETAFGYFRVSDMDNKTLLADQQPCTKWECSLLEDANLILERISMVHVLDASVHIENPVHTAQGRFLHTPTKLEYLLKYFYPEKGFPDFWLFMLPYHHECWSNSLDEMRADLVYMMRMFEMFLPSTTQLLFLSDTRACPDFDDENIIAEMKKRNINYNKCIDDMNQLTVEIFLEMDLPDNIHVYLDFNKLTCPVVCKWHKGGQHMQPGWYQFIFKSILESFC